MGIFWQNVWFELIGLEYDTLDRGFYVKTVETCEGVSMITLRQKHAPPGSYGSRDRQPKADKYFAKAVGKAFRILEIVKQTSEPISLNQLTQSVQSAKSSVFRIIHTLEVLGYLEKTSGDRYILSPTISSLVPNYLLHRLIGVANPHMRNLAREFRETISLGFLFQNHIEVVEVIESPQKIQMGNIVGSIIPPHASSIGKSITAYQPEWRRDRLLRTYGLYQHTPHTITDEVELKKELDLIRARGYAIDMEETTLEGCCFGAPICGNGDQAIAAVSISLPKMRLKNEEKVIAAVRSAAAAISADLKAP